MAMAASGITAQDPFFCTSAFRGNALHASLPGPYGEFAANGANNFCLPNGPYGNDLCTAVPDRGYEEGALVDLPAWKDQSDQTIAVGQSPRIALLRPVDGGRYRVEVVVR